MPATDLQAAVRRFTELELARDLLPRYAAAADANALDDMVALFEDDAVLATRQRTYRGTEEISGFFTSAWQRDPSRKRHFVTNVSTRWVREGSVEVASYLLYVARADLRSVIGWGAYDTSVAVRDDRARFARFDLNIILATDLSAGWPREPDVAE